MDLPNGDPCTSPFSMTVTGVFVCVCGEQWYTSLSVTEVFVCLVNSSTPPLPVRIEDFVDHVIDMHRDSDYQFSHEYAVRTL